MSKNPYAQVALTYVRRPFSSWHGSFLSLVFFLMLIPLLRIGGVGKHLDFGLPHLMVFVFLFAYIAAHARGQLADWRAPLMPGFRRVHAAVGAVATLISAVLLPAALACYLGWHPLGLVAVAVLLFGTTLWVIVKDATWTCFAIAGVWLAMLSMEPGRAWFQALVSGQIQSQAAAILGLGILITLLAGIRLARFNEDMPGYQIGTLWESDGSQKTRQWSDEGRILPVLRDWIRERQMTRLTRLASRASRSWWSRICRWQAGMAAGCSLWFWILGTLIFVQAWTWLVLTKTPHTVRVMLGATSLVLTFMPAIAAMGGVFYWRMFKPGHSLMLPVARKSYVRQWGTAAALSQFQLWAGMSIVLLFWWLLTGPRPLPVVMLVCVLAFSAAFQVGVFGVVVWTSRYRSRALGGFVLAMVFLAAETVELRWMRCWSVSPPEQLPHEVMWIAGTIAVLGLLIIYDAYRRWLVADFD